MAEGRMRGRWATSGGALAATVVAAALVLTGCTVGAGSDGSASATSASPSPSISVIEDSPLLPVYPPDTAGFTIEFETSRVAQAIVTSLGPEAVVNDDLHDQVVPATEEAAAYYGIIQTLTLDPALDSAEQARNLVLLLQQAGWTLRDTTDTEASYLSALLSSTDPQQAWFLIVGADLSVPGESVMTVQLASPDLPAE